MNKLRNLRTHVRNRKKTGPKIYYFYDMQRFGKADIPLGSDRDVALVRWAELDAKFPRQAKTPAPRPIRSPYDALPSWAKAMYNRAKHRQKKAGWGEFLSRDEFAALVNASPVCSVTGAAFEFGGRRNPMSPSIDRIDSRRGYESGNVRIVTLVANTAMSNWGEEMISKLTTRNVPEILAAPLPNSLSAPEHIGRKPA